MSERYSRLFSLPTNLYTEGAPVLIAAGALLKDNQTGKVLAQLKFRNISQKAIQSVKVKVNACDTAGCPLAGMDSFSYLDLSVAAGEEFGQSKPIYLPDATTRAFTVEILSVVFADHDVFTPSATPITTAAPKEVIEEVERAEAAKQAERERTKIETIKNKQSRWMMVIGFISLASVLLSIFLLINATHLPSLLVGATHLPFQMVEPRNSVRFLLALVIPCMCLLAAFAGKRKNGIIKAAFIICMVLFALQIVSIVACSVVFSSTEVSEETRYLASKFFRYVNGADFGMMLKRFMWVLRSGRGSRILQALENFAPSFFAVLPNLLCTAVLAVSSKKIK